MNFLQRMEQLRDRSRWRLRAELAAAVALAGASPLWLLAEPLPVTLRPLFVLAQFLGVAASLPLRKSMEKHLAYVRICRVLERRARFRAAAPRHLPE